MTSIECFGAALIQDDPYDRMLGSTQRCLLADPSAFHHKGYRGSPAGGDTVWPGPLGQPVPSPAIGSNCVASNPQWVMPLFYKPATG